MSYRRKTASAVGRARAQFDDRGLLAGKQRRRLTDEQEKAVRAAWAEGANVRRAAEAAGITPALLRFRLRDQLVDLPRRGQGAGPKGRFAELSQDEIRRRCAEVRKTWPPERYGIREPLPAELEVRMGRTIENVIPSTIDD